MDTWIAELVSAMGKPVTKPEKAQKICAAVGATLLQSTSDNGEWEVRVPAAMASVVMDRGFVEKRTDYGTFMIRAGGTHEAP